MNPEIKSALIRVLPFVIILFTLFVFVKRKKINPQELDIHKPPSMNRFYIQEIHTPQYMEHPYTFDKSPCNVFCMGFLRLDTPFLLFFILVKISFF
jgi:hypothetical protein